jgi:hypothetical protein
MAVCNYCYKSFIGEHECPSGLTFTDNDSEHLMKLAPPQPVSQAGEDNALLQDV